MLKQNNILLSKIPAHSSHLCQILDLSIFGNWKNKLKTVIVDQNLTPQSQRIVKGLKALEMCCNHSDIISSFHKGGIIANLEPGQESLTVDYSFVTNSKRAIQSQGDSTKKVKRVKLKGTKKKEKINKKNDGKKII